MDAIIELDKEILLFLNGLHNSFFDGFMYWISDRWIWIPMYAALLYPIIVRKKQGTVLVAVCIALCVLFADQFASGFCKPFFERLRPSHDPAIMDMVHIVKGNRSGLYGFISSHAANTFAVAVFTICLFRKWMEAVPVVLWALLNSYSRIYLGVHFPLDIIMGALAGTVVGFACYGIYLAGMKYLPASITGKAESAFDNADFIPLIIVLVLTIFFICLFSSRGFVS